MDGTKGLKETTRVTAPVASNTLSVNVFTAPGKTMVGERPKPFGEALGFDPITSTLVFGEYDAVLVDAMGTVAEAEALAAWVALHNRNLEELYPHWVANQSWLMFGFPQPEPTSTADANVPRA